MSPAEQLKAAILRIQAVDPEKIDVSFAGEFMTEQMVVLAETVADFIEPR